MVASLYSTTQQEINGILRVAKSLPRDFERAVRGYMTVMLADLAAAHPGLAAVRLGVDRADDGARSIVLQALNQDRLPVRDALLSKHAAFLTKAAATLYGDRAASWEALVGTFSVSPPPKSAARSQRPRA